MNKLRKITTMIVALATIIGFYSCSSDDNVTAFPSDEFSSSLVSSNFTDNGGVTTLSVKSGVLPSVSTDASWITVDYKKQGALAYIYTLTVEPYVANSSNMTGYDDRTATITVTAGNNTDTKTITQTPEYGLFVTSSKNININADGEVITVTLKSNTTNYNITTSDNWIVDNSTRASLNDYSHVFTIYSNLGVARTGTISFTYDDHTESVTVSQAAGSNLGVSHNANELAKLMYPGWNLGNTLEGGNAANIDNNEGGLSAETSWQSSKTSQVIIDQVKALGFKSVRIPCAWVMGHISNSSNTTIDEKWMSRVKEIVDYCINVGLYVEINDHWDGGWLENSFTDVSETNITKNSKKLKMLWTQIANNFKNYDEHLLFGGLNEPNAKTKEQTDALVKYEEAFIEAVRATGANNASRVLVVQGPSTNIDYTNQFFTMPKDPTISGRLMAEVHFYDPYQFCLMTEDASWGKMWYYWGNGNNGDTERTSTSAWNESYIDNQFKKMKTQFVDNGIPVLLGEYGANCRFSNDTKHMESLKSYYKAVNMYAINNGIIPFAWDTNGLSYPNMTILNRNSLSVSNQYMLDGIIEGVKAGVWPE